MASRSDSDGWTIRLTHLAALLHADAVAIVLPSGAAPTTYAAYNLVAVEWAHTAAAATLMNVLAQRTPAQLGGAGIPLADGRSAGAVAVDAIAAEDAAALPHAADLVAIELADANAAYRTQRTADDLHTRLRIV